MQPTERTRRCLRSTASAPACHAVRVITALSIEARGPAAISVVSFWNSPQKAHCALDTYTGEIAASSIRISGRSQTGECSRKRMRKCNVSRSSLSTGFSMSPPRRRLSKLDARVGAT
ncbi:MAG: hypothetical protein SGPRY_014877, partial [Prymnesium sp.]